MAKRKVKAPDNTWRKLTGSEKPGRRKRAASSGRRWKLYLGLCTALLLVTGVIVAVLFSAHLPAPEVSLPQPIPEEKVEQIVLRTDGVLREEQLWQMLDLTRSHLLSELDIFALKHRLESHGQIRNAVIERRYPSTLAVEIAERQPVLRLMTMRDGQRQILLISSEGSVFQGVNYSVQTLRRLPFLDLPPGNLRLVGQEQYAALKGMESVAQLLELAQVRYPHVYARWRVVDLHEYDPSPAAAASLIRVRTMDQVEVVFMAENYPQQLERLDYILQHTAETGQAAIQTIDLSLASPVVRFVEG